jgi:thiol-disulfide isomerase/thioredoxin
MKMNREKFPIEEKLGKWVLVDFGGTWCAPYRAEHPDLQKLYKNMYNNVQNFELLTITCRDDSSKVNDYMKAKSYDFPVAMADDKIEKLYPKNGYPSNFLITPQGIFLIIPFSIDLVSFIKNYIDL